jgi:bifunctional non-homologous end joining protein LigD
MKNCAWLKAELVAQIEFTEWTPDGHLRHSKFVRLRADEEAREVYMRIKKPGVTDALQLPATVMKRSQESSSKPDRYTSCL